MNRLVQNVAGYALMGEAFQQSVGPEFWALYGDLGRALDPLIPPHWLLPKFRRRDRAKAHITKISEMGLVEMSRKRTRESLLRGLTAGCETCKGRGYTKSPSTMVYEILREVRREAPHLAGDTVVVHVSPAVAEVMKGSELPALDNTVKRVQKGIDVQSRKDFHIEHFEIRSRTTMRD